MLSSTIERHNKKVVSRIVSATVKVKIPGWYGSGTIVFDPDLFNEPYVVTAYHTFEHLKKPFKKKIEIEDVEGTTAIGHLVTFDKALDYAIIQFDATAYDFKRTAIKRVGTVDIGMTVWNNGAGGYPAAITRGVVSEGPFECGGFYCDFLGAKGSSGSGVFDYKGRFVGIVRAEEVHGKYRMDFVPWDTVADHLMFDNENFNSRPEPGFGPL